MLMVEGRKNSPYSAANDTGPRNDCTELTASAEAPATTPSSTRTWTPRRLTSAISDNRKERRTFFLVAIVLIISICARTHSCQAFCPPCGPQPRSSPSSSSSTSKTPPRLQPLAVGMVWDVLAPARYALEKSVASRSIPNVSRIENRLRLQDCFEGDDGDAFDHSLWTTVLKRHVSTGGAMGKIENLNVVDYAAISKDDDFWAYLKSLEQAQPERLSKREQLAFWMNAYNALCIATVVNHETTTGKQLESITKLSSVEKGPIWDQVVPNCRIGDKDITLNTIEHVHLRSVWAEPAVHACIVCASASCPNLRTEAFEANRLVDQMNDQMRDWVSNPTKGLKLMVPAPSSTSSSRSQRNRLELSRIFLWFADDFGGIQGLSEWLPQFIDDPHVSDEALASAVVRYFEYDWQINRAPARVSVSAAAAATSS